MDKPEEEYDERATWRVRKEKYIAHLKKASPEAKLVSCADKIQNLTSFINDYRRLKDEIWRWRQRG
jgi:hypothetical protein